MAELMPVQMGGGALSACAKSSGGKRIITFFHGGAPEQPPAGLWMCPGWPARMDVFPRLRPHPRTQRASPASFKIASAIVAGVLATKPHSPCRTSSICAWSKPRHRMGEDRACPGSSARRCRSRNFRPIKEVLQPPTSNADRCQAQFAVVGGWRAG